eukprot:73333-Hanusia_phi.AAC.2
MGGRRIKVLCKEQDRSQARDVGCARVWRENGNRRDKIDSLSESGGGQRPRGQRFVMSNS